MTNKWRQKHADVTAAQCHHNDIINDNCHQFSLQISSTNVDVVAEQHDRLNLISEGGRMHDNTRREGGPETEVHFSPEDSLCPSIPVYGACCSKKSNFDTQIVCFLLCFRIFVMDWRTDWRTDLVSEDPSLGGCKMMEMFKKGLRYKRVVFIGREWY